MNKKRILKISIIAILFCMMVSCFYFAYDIHMNRRILFNPKDITITEKSTSGFKVNYFANQRPGNTDQYIFHLIDNINLNYNYVLNFSKKVKGKYSYYIQGVVRSENNSIVKDVYKSNLVGANFDNTVINLVNGIDIDPSEFKDTYDELKKEYDISIDSNLEYYLIFSLDIIDHNKSFKRDFEQLLISIPLKDNTMIKDNNTETNYHIDTIKDDNIYLLIIFEFLLASVFLGLVIILIMKDLSIDVNDYEKKISNILAKYGDIIVNLNVLPDLSRYTVLFVTNFVELVDASESLNVPINFVNIIDHKKSIFFVYNGNNIYVLNIEKGRK